MNAQNMDRVIIRQYRDKDGATDGDVLRPCRTTC